MSIGRRSVAPSINQGKHVPILVLNITLEPEFDVMTAVLPRLRAVKAIKQSRDYIDKNLNITRWKLQRLVGEDIDIATGFLHKMGNAVSALETYIFIERLSPTYVFLCGIAGSLDEKVVRLGDVVFANSIDWLVIDKIASEPFHSSLQIGDKHCRINRRSNTALNERWERTVAAFVNEHKDDLASNQEDDWMTFKSSLGTAVQNEMHLGGIMSVDYVVNDEDLKKKLAGRYGGAYAVEMEGGGFEYALRRRREEHSNGENGPWGFVIRGVSDLCHNKDGEDQRWRRLAMHNVADTLAKFLNTFSDETIRDYWTVPPALTGGAEPSRRQSSTSRAPSS